MVNCLRGENPQSVAGAHERVTSARPRQMLFADMRVILTTRSDGDAHRGQDDAMLRQSDSRKETQCPVGLRAISAVAAALTAAPAKLGVEGVPSALATAIRTVVVVVSA